MQKSPEADNELEAPAAEGLEDLGLNLPDGTPEGALIELLEDLMCPTECGDY